MTDKLDTDEVKRRASEGTPGWALEDDGGTLRKTFVFHDFVHALHFVNRLGESAEEAQHHPDLDIRYNKVTVALSTHDAGGITEKDFALAEEAERAASVVRAAA
jgi:4a-hydroxytetrahydrobiopterin dehydratase